MTADPAYRPCECRACYLCDIHAAANRVPVQTPAAIIASVQSVDEPVRNSSTSPSLFDEDPNA